MKALIELILNTSEISVGTCFLLIYPPLYESDVNFNRIVRWLREKFSSAQQSLLLIANYCNTHQLQVKNWLNISEFKLINALHLQLLNEYVSNLIGFKLQLKSVSLSAMSRVFQQVFPDDQLLNEYMRNLPITPKLNSSMSLNQSSNANSNSTLGIHFLNQWIKNNSFLNKRQLDLNTWLLRQIKECTQPLHSIIITLINTYVSQLFNLNILFEYRLVPLASQLILEFFQQKYFLKNGFFLSKI